MTVLVQMIAGQSVRLTKQIASSGEGTVWKTNRAGYLAKLYHIATPDRIQKLQVMVAHPPRDPMANRGHVTFAWPQDLLQDQQGQCLGFLMPEVDESVKLSTIYNAKLRSRSAPRFNWYYLHTTALNIALAMQSLHQEGYVVGDVKPQNILVNSQALVSVIDTDSFQVRDPHTRTLYRCLVGSEGFTPAELLGQDLADLDQTEIHDRFRLAVIIYLLLFGDQPFKGRWVGTGDSPQPSELIKAGHWPFGKGSLIQPGPHTIPLSIIHPQLQSCFQRCFSRGHLQPQDRPSAGEWVNALQLARADLATCHLEVNHVYSRSYGRCYWCDRKAKLNIDIFSPQPKPKTKPPIKPQPSRRPPVTATPRRQAANRAGQYVPPSTPDRWAPSKTTLGGLLCLSSLAGLALLVLPDASPIPQALERSLDQKLTHTFEQLARSIRGSNTDTSQNSVSSVAAPRKPALKGHGDSILTLAISPNGQLLISGSRDFTLKVWSLQTGQLLRTLSEHYEPITSAQFADQGKTLISRGTSGKVLFWDIETGKVRHQLEATPTSAINVNVQGGGASVTTLNAGGTLLASHTWDGNIMLRDLRTNEIRQIEAESVSAQQAIAITPDAQTLVSSTIDGQIKLWDIPTGEFQRSFPKFDDWDAIKAMQLTSSLSVSYDGTRLASGGWGGDIHLWDMQTGTLMKVLTAHHQSISALAFSADNKILASGGGDRIINVWRIQDASLLHTLKGHQADISALSISPDGQFLVSGSNDHTIRIWQLATGKLLRVLGKT